MNSSHNNKKRRRLECDEDDIKFEDNECCGVSYLRNLLYIFNIIFLLSGFALIAIGLWVLLAKFSYISFFLSEWYKGITYLTISCGGLIVLVTLCGCCGAKLPNSSCLGTFSTFLMLIFLIEISIGVLAYFYEFMIEDEMSKALTKTILTEYSYKDQPTHAIDSMQRQLKCCGSESYVDWQKSRWMENYTQLHSNPVVGLIKFKTPDSCCITEVADCGARLHPSNIYTDGCAGSLEISIKEHLTVMGALGLGLCCLQIFGVIFSCCLIKRLQTWRGRQRLATWKS